VAMISDIKNFSCRPSVIQVPCLNVHKNILLPIYSDVGLLIDCFMAKWLVTFWRL